MNRKRIKARLVPKGDTEANLNKATGFIPLEKEIIIYKPDEKHNYSRFKIGDGVTPVSDLPFAAESIIDVGVLPNQGIDTSTFYRIKIEKPASISFMAGGEAISEEDLSMNFTIVDILPENVATVDADTGYVNIFIRTDRTGWVYVDEYFAPEIGMDKGWYTLEQAGLPSEIVSSPEEAQDPNPEILYIIYEEAVCKYKLYYYTDRWQEVGGPIDTSIIPTKTSELENDSQYITVPELEEGYVKKTDYATAGGGYGLVKLTTIEAGGIRRTIDGGHQRHETL